MNADRFNAWTEVILVPETRRSLLRAAVASRRLSLPHPVCASAPRRHCPVRSSRRVAAASGPLRHGVPALS